MIESTSTFFRLSQDLLCVTNSEGLLLEVNPAWQHVLGWASSDLVHQPFMDFVHPEDREGTITQAGLVAKSGVCAKHENRIRHKDGSYRQVLWTGAYDLSSKNFYGAARDITEQVSSYQQLKNTQRQLEAVFNSMLEGVVVQNGKGEVIHYNQTALKITGLSDEQMLGNTAQHPRWNIINESGQKIQASQHPASLARATGRPQTNQIIGICNAGAPTKWVCITAVPLFNAGDLTPYQIVVTFRDITEEKSARDLLQSMSEKLAKRKRFLKATLNSLPSLVSYVDQNLVYQYVNRAYENWFSVSSREIIGKTVEQFTGPAVFEFLKPKLSAALLGEQQDFETLAPYRLGGTRTVRVSYIPDISESGQAQGVYAIVHDVTAQIEAQSLLRKKDLEVIKLLNSIPALIGHWDRNLINRHANEVYSDYFGKTPAEIKGQHIQDVLGRELYEKNKPYIQGVLRGETQIFEFRDISGNDIKTLNFALHDVGDISRKSVSCAAFGNRNFSF